MQNLVQLDRSKCDYVGATVCNNFVAEVNAIAWAVLWYVQFPFHVSVSINYDCTPAADVIAGRANARNHCCTLKLSRAVLRACCTCPVAWSHVKGHSGNPWNELCDALANGVADGRVSGSPEVFPHPDLAAADPHALR